MKVGDYVRTDDGCICKVLEYTEISNNDYYVNTDSPYNVIYKSWIVKSSPNIIDLIEVGDYVNGMKVFEVMKNQETNDIKEHLILFTDELNNTLNSIYGDDIKSIVTKEQFESMEYKIRG